MLARWLAEDCRLLLLDEPFQGVDIRARRDIGRKIRETSANRATLVFVSELDEALEVADRIIVMTEHSVSAEFRNTERGSQRDPDSSNRVRAGTFRQPARQHTHEHDLDQPGKPPARVRARQNRSPSPSADRSSPSATASWRLLVGLVIFFSVFANGFAGPRSAVFIFQSVAITGILALGVTCTLVVGGFDLSIGSVATSSMMLSAYMMVVLEQSPSSPSSPAWRWVPLSG
jgi:hypothetical protein